MSCFQQLESHDLATDYAHTEAIEAKQDCHSEEISKKLEVDLKRCLEHLVQNVFGDGIFLFLC